MEIKVTSNAAAAVAAMEAVPAATVARVAKVVDEAGAMLQARVKFNAAEPRTAPRPGARGGTDGPRLLTGDYNRSIGRVNRVGATTISASVGTNRPQGRRLEFGFIGADARGRIYDQRAYPHFGPALDDVAPVFETLLAKAITEPGVGA